MLIHLCLRDLPILLLSFGQMCHNLRQLHFAQLIQFFGFEHARLDLPHSLRKDLDLLVWQVLSLDAVGAEHFASRLVP